MEEETYLVARRLGIRVRQPFWDPELIDLLARVRPRSRTADGLAKALVRRPLIRRFPQLGFERQRKSWLGAAMLEVLAAQASAAYHSLGGIRKLGELGVVGAEQVDGLVDQALSGGAPASALGPLWDLLNLETWVRARG